MTNIRDLEPEPYVVPLSYDGTELLSFDMVNGAGGWAALLSNDVGFDQAVAVYLRIGPEDATPGSAWEVREVRFVLAQGGKGFSSSVLRDLPVMRIEAAVNQAEHREALARVVAPANAHELEIVGVRFRSVRPEPARARRPRLRIADPGGYRKPDAFYQQVAEKFLALSAVSTRPALDIAEANQIPAATVHRWIREAKARGVLVLPSHRGDG